MNYVPKERLYKMTNSTVINLLNHTLIFICTFHHIYLEKLLYTLHL